MTGYSITPALPAGLSLNTSTGVISGTPSTTLSATAFTVNAASASNGSTSFGLTLTVNQMPAPSALSYAGNPFSIVQDLAITTLTPTFSGTVSSCSASGLPAGLSINSTNCQITGTPTTLQGATNYTITATNAGGSTTFVITITVNDLPNQCFTYTSVSGDDRHTGLTGTVLCDSTMNNTWVRFTGTYSKMATATVAVNYCNTHAPGNLTFAHPATKAQTTSGTVCFNYSGNACNFSASAEATNCNGYFVYKLPATTCSLRYCTTVP